jgi:hypothetical protein
LPHRPRADDPAVGSRLPHRSGTHGNEVILAAVESFGGDFGWTYTAGAADFGVSTIQADGLQANGTDGTMGSFDLDRVAELIALAVPIYTEQGSPPKDGIVPDDIVTNQFIDPSIAL